jgi:hypothetical protein
MKAKALAVAGGKEPAAENWDYSVKPITGNELSTTGEEGRKEGGEERRGQERRGGAEEGSGKGRSREECRGERESDG